MSGVVANRGERPFIPNAQLPDIIRSHEDASSLPLTTKSAVQRWVAEGKVPHERAGRRILVPADAPAVRDAAKAATQFGSIQPAKFIRRDALLDASGLPQGKLDRGLERLSPSPFVAVDGAPLFERPALEAAGLLTKPAAAGRVEPGKAVARRVAPGMGKAVAKRAANGAEVAEVGKKGVGGKLFLAGAVVVGALAAKAAVSSAYPADNRPARDAAGWGAAGGVAGSAGAIALLSRRAPAAAANARGLLMRLRGPALLGAAATAGFMMTSDNTPLGAAARMAGPAAVLTGVASLPFLIKGGHARAAKDVLKLAVPVAGAAIAANVIGNLTSSDAPATGATTAGS